MHTDEEGGKVSLKIARRTYISALADGRRYAVLTRKVTIQAPKATGNDDGTSVFT